MLWEEPPASTISMPYVGFCSSLVRGHDELRRGIHDLGQEFGGVYVAEIDDPTLPDDPLESMDYLMELIRRTPVLFCIIGASAWITNRANADLFFRNRTLSGCPTPTTSPHP